MDVLLHLEPNPTPFHCRWDRFQFQRSLLPLKPNLSFSAAVLEDENRAFTWAILLVRASFIHQNKNSGTLEGGVLQEIFSAAHIELHERAYLEGLDLQHLKLNPGSTPANLLLHLQLWFVGQQILLE